MDHVGPAVRVFLVDDHEVVRRGVAEVLEDDPGLMVAGEAGSVAEALARVIGYAGRLDFDATKPDGTPRKLMDVSRLRAMGWQQEIDLDRGLHQTYGWFLENHATLRG